MRGLSRMLTSGTHVVLNFERDQTLASKTSLGTAGQRLPEKTELTMVFCVSNLLLLCPK